MTLYALALYLLHAAALGFTALVAAANAPRRAYVVVLVAVAAHLALAYPLADAPMRHAAMTVGGIALLVVPAPTPPGTPLVHGVLVSGVWGVLAFVLLYLGATQ